MRSQVIQFVRRRLRFSVRQLLLITLVAALAVAFAADFARRALVQRHIVAELEARDVFVLYDYLPPGRYGGVSPDMPISHVPPWFVQAVGIDVVASVFQVSAPKHGCDAESISLIARLPDLRHLAICGPLVSNESTLCLSALARLKSLRLLDTNLDPESLRHCGQTYGHNVTALTLAGPNVDQAWLKQLAYFPKLRYLQLQETNISEHEIRELLKVSDTEPVVVTAPMEFVRSTDGGRWVVKLEN